jgi:coenzyme F420-reducing hydrogenase delta subunit
MTKNIRLFHNAKKIASKKLGKCFFMHGNESLEKKHEKLVDEFLKSYIIRVR